VLNVRVLLDPRRFLRVIQGGGIGGLESFRDGMADVVFYRRGAS